MTKQDFIQSIRKAYPNGFVQVSRDNYERTRETPLGGVHQHYNLLAVSKIDRYESICMFNSFQGGEGERFVVNLNLKRIEKGKWQKQFLTFEEAIALYTELIGVDAEWHIRVKKTYKLENQAV